MAQYGKEGISPTSVSHCTQHRTMGWVHAVFFPMKKLTGFHEELVSANAPVN